MSLFERIAAMKNAMGIGPQDAKASRDWFRKQAVGFRNVSGTEMFTDNKDRILKSRYIGQQHVGRLIMFFYDPKTKEKLPYYDRFPVVFPIEMGKSGANGEQGFLGINLHYLSPVNRAKLMDALYKIEQNKTMDEKYRMRLSYRLLKGFTSVKMFKPCIKHYLFPYVKSRFLNVAVPEWDFIVALPLERFEQGGAKGGKVGGPVNKTRIWADSMAKL